MNSELERLRRRIAVLESGAGPGIYDEGYRLLFESNPLPLWVYDLETLAFLAVNEAALSKYGYSREEFLGMTITGIRPPEDVSRLLENIAQVTEGLDEAGVWRHRRKDGSVIDVEIVSHTLMFEGRKAELVLANDITGRKQAEAKLRNVTRLYAFLSQINQAIVRTRDRDELFRTICQVAIDFGQFRMAWVGLVDEATGIVQPIAHAGREEGYLNVLSIRIGDEVTGKGPTGSALREEALTICDDIATDPRMLPWREETLKRGYRSSAAIPFRLKEKVVGSLNLYAAEPGFFTADEQRLLTEIGIDISFALDTMEGEKDRKRAEEALQESEEQYRAIFEGIGDAVFVHRPDKDGPTGRFIAVNDVACRHLGYTREELLSLSLSQVDPLDEAVIQSVLQTLSAGREALFETAHIRKDGQRVPVEVRARIIQYLGAPAVLSVARDITDRKRAEKELLQRTTGLATLLEVSKGLAATLERETVLQATTDGVTQLFGMGTAAVYLLEGATLRLGATTPPLLPQFPEALRNAPLADHPHILQAITSRMPVFIPDMATADLTSAERAVAEQRGLRTLLFLPLIAGVKSVGILIVGSITAPRTISDTEVDLCRTLANLAALAVENTGLYRSGQKYAADLEQTLSDRKQTEARLRQSEERLRLALSAAKQGLYDLNVQTGETVVTPEYAQMLGYAPEEFIETNAKWIERLHPDDRAPVADTYRAYVSGALPDYRVEFRQRTKSGEWKWILSIGKIVEYDAAGKPLRMLGTHTDITDRKQIEQERLELERRLLHSQKLESLGILAGGIAHDFNNLLMAVLGNLDLALRSLSPVSPARVNIEQSAQAARRATDLTRQMLAYSGKGRFVVKALDLSELVEENAHLFRASVPRTTKLDLRLGRLLPAIEADAGQVQQVIMNLITNASEAIGEGAGMITLSTGAQECDSQCLQQSRVDAQPGAGRFVFLEASDNGCGMDEETQQRLFDPFFTTKSMGRGLGMSAILGIVRGHRGAIMVDSVAGRGTTIRILFPAWEGAQAISEGPVDARHREAAAPALSGTVLVVDDEEIVRQVCKEMVEALGFQVLTAVDGRDAVDLFTKQADHIDLVLLDLSMPHMDGMTTFQELVRISPGVKVILCSGYDEQDSLHRLSGARPAGFIQKPYSMNNLRDALEKAGRDGQK